ncbi:MAG: chemotaxis protein CheX [Magnetococcales bacterium]|nr:chemotaxis protein CheX [Magnetococcales bacterium]
MQDVLLSAIESGVLRVFETMLFLPVTPGPGLAKPSMVPYVPAPAEVSAIVGLGGGVDGGVRLACTVDAALIIASALAVEEYPEFGGESKDAFAEVANMVAGGVQTKMEPLTKQEIHLTPPSVIMGQDYAVDFKSDLESVRKFFSMEQGTFYVEIYYRSATETRLGQLLEVELPKDTLLKLDEMAGNLKADRSEVLARLIDGGHRFFNRMRCSQ